jgi:hypothetical protein
LLATFKPPALCVSVIGITPADDPAGFGVSVRSGQFLTGRPRAIAGMATSQISYERKNQSRANH